jgi:hypothetical protein
VSAAYVLTTRTEYVLAIFPTLSDALALSHYESGDRITRHTMGEPDSGVALLTYHDDTMPGYWTPCDPFRTLDREIEHLFDPGLYPLR